jgi:hypothetical protein
MVMVLFSCCSNEVSKDLRSKGLTPTIEVHTISFAEFKRKFEDQDQDHISLSGSSVKTVLPSPTAPPQPVGAGNGSSANTVQNPLTAAGSDISITSSTGSFTHNPGTVETMEIEKQGAR